MSIVKICISGHSLFTNASFCFFVFSWVVSPLISDLRFLLLAIIEDEFKLLNGRDRKKNSGGICGEVTVTVVYHYRFTSEQHKHLWVPALPSEKLGTRFVLENINNVSPAERMNVRKRVQSSCERLHIVYRCVCKYRIDT